MTRSLRRSALAAAVLACAWASSGVHAAVAAAPTEPSHQIVTRQGDTVIGLARRLLADPRRWPELARANKLRDPNRIATGMTLDVPLRLMRSEVASATLLSVVGDAKVDTAATVLQAGQTVPEGGELRTGADGHVTIQLVDGTLLRLRPDSRLQLRESRRLRDAAAVRSGARLQQGRVEIEAAPAAAGRPGFTIDTPQGVLGVRGTEFRVASDPVLGLTFGEVLGGTVLFEGRTGSSAQRVSAGQGSVIGSSGGVAPPVPLLGPPDAAAWPVLQERILMRFVLAQQEGAVAYRGQIARDATFDAVVADLTSAQPELRFAELPDGDYVLRARAIDARGLEGRDTDHRFRLKARPEAPLPSAPPPRAVSFGSAIDLAWTLNDQAQSYRLQLADEPAFKAPLRDLHDLRGGATQLDGLQPGVYHWRLASVRGDSDQGPWGDGRTFELRPLPPAPKPPVVGDHSIVFAWEGAPGQTFEFEVARDAAFADKVFERTLTQPGIELPLPSPGHGRFYVRLRARDPDGFVGPYTTPQHFDVPNCVRDGSGSCVRAGTEILNLTP